MFFGAGIELGGSKKSSDTFLPNGLSDDIQTPRNLISSEFCCEKIRGIEGRRDENVQRLFERKKGIFNRGKNDSTEK